jgi:pyridoxal phosphate enzyme (YggS family)
MAINKEMYLEIMEELRKRKAILVAVSKTKPVEDILALYELGHRDFGENYVQELLEKQAILPKDIRWHFIGHLQTNKVKAIAPFVHLVHGVDSYKLLSEINKQGQKINRCINVLLQIHIAREETKFGLDENEVKEILDTGLSGLSFVSVKGFMGMASFTEDKQQVQNEFHYLKGLYDQHPQMQTLSMGMSGDYKLALQEGSTMVRVGSLIFGERNYPV